MKIKTSLQTFLRGIRLAKGLTMKLLKLFAAAALLFPAGCSINIFSVSNTATSENDSTTTVPAYTYPPSRPTHVSAVAVSESTVAVAWDSAYGAASYAVEVFADPAGVYLSAYKSLFNAANHYTLTRLDPGINYYIGIIAYNSIGASQLSSIVSAKTPGVAAGTARICAYMDSSGISFTSWPISIYIDGQLAGSLTTYCSQRPSAGDSRTVTVARTKGTRSIYAQYGSSAPLVPRTFELCSLNDPFLYALHYTPSAKQISASR